jgi:hypothetical protein
MKQRIKFVATAVLWRDRVNGNTYHSVRIVRCRDSKALKCPFQYGYGDQYRQTALSAMAASRWIPARYAKRNANGSDSLYLYERENHYPIFWSATVGSKRDCIANGS